MRSSERLERSSERRRTAIAWVTLELVYRIRQAGGTSFEVVTAEEYQRFVAGEVI